MRKKSGYNTDVIPDPNFEEIIQAVDDIFTHIDGESLLGPFIRLTAH